MIELNKNQKIILIIAIVIIVIVIGYYIFISIQNNETENFQENNLIESEEKNKKETEEIVIHIAGAVENSGIQKIPQDSRIIDAIEAAGGLTSDANINSINLAQKIYDGQKIYIPSVNDDETTIQLEMQNPNNIYDTENLVNINTATQTELETVSGIGPSTATKIIEYRKANGNFKNIEDIQNVSGIGEAKYAQIKNSITV